MAYPATGNSGNVTTGPGWLYVAPLGTAEPTSSSAVLPSAWQEVGFTDAGSTFTTDITSEGIEVAETPDRIATVQTTRVTTIAFAMAETTRRNLLLALGAGVGVNNAAVIHLPDFTDLVDVMIVLQAVDGARWVFPSVSPSGQISIANQKAPQKRLIAVTFNVNTPSGGGEPVSIWPNASALV
jgi:hypothetical protein